MLNRGIINAKYVLRRQGIKLENMHNGNTGKADNYGGISVKCENCGRTDKEAAMFPVRIKGESTWVCAKCIPMLIHG